jgi:ABC transport system ATP-binding/permease protein
MLTLKNIVLRFGGPALLDKVSLVVERGERVCILGRNGEGKSTLLRVIAGTQVADDGEVIKAPGMRVAEMPQDIPKTLPGTVRDVVASGLGLIGQVLADYHHTLTDIEQASPEAMDALLSKLGRLQGQLDNGDGWSLDARVEAIVTKLELPGDTPFDKLSGGFKRRALLGKALALEPDLLLLDEPTNHLDLESIAWIEEFLKGWDGALLFITHDRAFLRALATRIIELDRGQLSSWPGDYDNYLRRKEERLASEAKTLAEFDKKMAQEEIWIRKGVQARRTRDMGRVYRLMEMRKQYAERRNQVGKAEFAVIEAANSGKLVAEAKKVSYAVGGRTLLKDVNLNVIRGDKIGIVGPNGAGKTTLLNLLLGRLQPTTGDLKTGTNIEVAWFDQMRSALDPDKPVWENIAGGKEFVTVGVGENAKQKHVMGYLQEFLFTPDRARQPTRVLSGGERSRLLLAQLFSEPANLLVLDEPTNDLDVETLDLLEELLLDFGGTVLVVSHDRAFLDNVATRTIAFEGEGRVADYVGGYSDWLKQRPGARVASKPASTQKSASASQMPKPTQGGSGSALSSKEKRELELLPAQIEKMETEQTILGGQLADLYAKDQSKAIATQKKLTALQTDLNALYLRWETLEARKSN